MKKTVFNSVSFKTENSVWKGLRIMIRDLTSQLIRALPEQGSCCQVLVSLSILQIYTIIQTKPSTLPSFLAISTFRKECSKSIKIFNLLETLPVSHGSGAMALSENLYYSYQCSTHSMVNKECKFPAMLLTLYCYSTVKLRKRW